MTISRNAIKLLKVTDFKMIVCPPSSMLKLKVLILKL